MAQDPITGEDTVRDWHPRLQALHRYWQCIHPAAGLPARRHLDPAAIRDLLPTLWMLDVYRQPLRFRYRLVGTTICEVAGRELTGLWVDEAHPHIIRSPEIMTRFEKVAISGIPSRRRGRPTLFLAHKDWTEIENVLLPFASDGIEVDMILACTVLHPHGGRAP